jgi:hypothetical protein
MFVSRVGLWWQGATAVERRIGTVLLKCAPADVLNRDAWSREALTKRIRYAVERFTRFRFGKDPSRAAV